MKVHCEGSVKFLMMDKKRIKAAVEAIILSRYAAQGADVNQPAQSEQITNVLIDGGGPNSLFKGDLGWQESKQLYQISGMINLTPDNIVRRASGILSSMGYRPGVTYTPYQIKQFSLAVANDLNNVINSGGFGKFLNK